MPDRDPALSAALDEILPRDERHSDWEGVLRDATRSRLRVPLPPFPRRRTALLAAAAALAALAPLAAVAAAEQWWFFGGPLAAPAPSGDVVVAQRGSSGGDAWVLTAYRTGDAGLCVAFAPGAAGPGAAPSAPSGAGGSSMVMSCGAHVRGIPATDGSTPEHELGFVSAAFPHGEVVGGPTAADVARVEVVHAGGPPVAVDTVAAPAALALPLRFYAVGLAPGDAVREVLALDTAGTVLETLPIPAS